MARDDDGKIVQTEQPEGPPPLFPNIRDEIFPDLPDTIPPLTERQVIWRHQLKTAWRSSPYFMKGEAGGTGAAANPGNKKRKADYVESYRTAAPAAGGPAADEPSADAFAAGGEPPPTITLHPSFFPQELYTKQKRSARSAAAESAYWAGQTARRAEARASTKDLALDKLEQLARREGQGAKAGGKGGGGAAEAEAEQEEVVEEVEEEDDDVADDDDYYQNEQFDDDEGYLDDYDDGGGDDAYY